jgi:hypothetical protein
MCFTWNILNHSYFLSLLLILLIGIALSGLSVELNCGRNKTLVFHVEHQSRIILITRIQVLHSTLILIFAYSKVLIYHFNVIIYGFSPL